MLRTSIAGRVLLTLATAASAQGYGYDRDYHDGYGHDARSASAHGQQRANSRCRDARDDQQLAGALVGGVLGAVAGGLIADNNTDDDGHHYYRRGRGYGYNGYHGYRGYRGYGRRGGYGYSDGNDGEVAAGVILGALVGGLAGSELAKNSVNCDTQWKYDDVPPPTRSAYGPGWGNAPQPVSAPARYGDRDQPLHGGPQGDGAIRDCEEVWRETRLPDGRVVREQVMACRSTDGSYDARTDYGDWEIRERCGLQTRDPECIG